MRKNKDAHSAGADEQYLQELSAVLDGESPHAESVLGEASSSDACRASWQSYHLIRDVMQNERSVALPTNFASQVCERISHEADIEAEMEPQTNTAPAVLSFADGRKRRASRPSVSMPAAARKPTWLPFAGLGLAASVAAAGFIGWQVISSDRTTLQPDITTAQVQAPQPALQQRLAATDTGLIKTVYQGADRGTRWSAVGGEHNAAVEQRLNSLLMTHLEDSNMSRVQGMVALSRVVGYDTGSVNDSF